MYLTLFIKFLVIANYFNIKKIIYKIIFNLIKFTNLITLINGIRLK